MTPDGLHGPSFERAASVSTCARARPNRGASISPVRRTQSIGCRETRTARWRPACREAAKPRACRADESRAIECRPRRGRRRAASAVRRNHCAADFGHERFWRDERERRGASGDRRGTPPEFALRPDNPESDATTPAASATPHAIASRAPIPRRLLSLTVRAVRPGLFASNGNRRRARAPRALRRCLAIGS